VKKPFFFRLDKKSQSVRCFVPCRSLPRVSQHHYARIRPCGKRRLGVSYYITLTLRYCTTGEIERNPQNPCLQTRFFKYVDQAKAGTTTRHALFVHLKYFSSHFQCCPRLFKAEAPTLLHDYIPPPGGSGGLMSGPCGEEARSCVSCLCTIFDLVERLMPCYSIFSKIYFVLE
jgi:hypothetical protein